MRSTGETYLARVPNRRLVMASLMTTFLCVCSHAHAQTLAGTKAWIESQGPLILGSPTGTRPGSQPSSVHDLVLDAETCVASWGTSSGLLARVPLRDLDTRGVVLRNSEQFSVPMVLLQLRTAAEAGPTILGWNMGKQQQVDSIEMEVRNRDDGEQLAAAFRRAAVLCGAAPPF